VTDVFGNIVSGSSPVQRSGSSGDQLHLHRFEPACSGIHAARRVYPDPHVQLLRGIFCQCDQPRERHGRVQL
jgi:hypothetical protein